MSSSPSAPSATKAPMRPPPPAPAPAPASSPAPSVDTTRSKHVDESDERIDIDIEDLDAAMEDLKRKWFTDAIVSHKYLIRPLHDAAAKGDVNELKRLIHNVDEEKEEKQDPDERDSAQNTALHWAAGAGRDDAVRFLLDSGCDINAINLLGDTALHRAVWRDQYSTVQLLVHRGIDRSVVNRQGHRAIHLVRNVEIGAFLQRFDPLSDNDDDDEDNDGRNPNEEGDSTVDREAGSPLATTTTSSGDGMTLGAYLNHLQMLGSSDDSATSSFLSRYQLDGYSDDDDDDDDENGSEEDDNIDG